MKKKTVIILASLLGMLLITAFAYSVRLINANQPFIDLSGSVKNAIANAGDAYIAANITPTPAVTPEVTQIPESQVTPSPTPAPTEAPKPLEIIVGGSVSGRVISVEGKECEIGDILGLINEKEESEVILADNWAEYNTYLEIEKVLKENGIDFSTETLD